MTRNHKAPCSSAGKSAPNFTIKTLWWCNLMTHRAEVNPSCFYLLEIFRFQGKHPNSRRGRLSRWKSITDHFCQWSQNWQNEQRWLPFVGRAVFRRIGPIFIHKRWRVHIGDDRRRVGHWQSGPVASRTCLPRADVGFKVVFFFSAIATAECSLSGGAGGGDECSSIERYRTSRAETVVVGGRPLEWRAKERSLQIWTPYRMRATGFSQRFHRSPPPAFTCLHTRPRPSRKLLRSSTCDRSTLAASSLQARATVARRVGEFSWIPKVKKRTKRQGRCVQKWSGRQFTNWPVIGDTEKERAGQMGVGGTKTTEASAATGNSQRRKETRRKRRGWALWSITLPRRTSRHRLGRRHATPMRETHADNVASLIVGLTCPPVPGHASAVFHFHAAWFIPPCSGAGCDQTSSSQSLSGDNTCLRWHNEFLSGISANLKHSLHQQKIRPASSIWVFGCLNRRHPRRATRQSRRGPKKNVPGSQ